MGYKILSKKELCPNQYEITIDAPYVVRNAKAGQFIIFRAKENSERVPLTIADVDKEKGELTLVFMAVGYSTKQLASLNVGDEIHDIVGPLGQPTHIKKYGTVVCLAGGYGAAPCYLIAKAFKEAGNKVYMIMGARTKDLIFWQDKMKEACTELYITTDDGSVGDKCNTVDKTKELLKEKTFDIIYTCGPTVMMKALIKVAKENNILCYASLEERMACGVNACLGCNIEIKDEKSGYTLKKVCHDGPVFNAELLNF